MSTLTLPGTIPNLLRRGSPVTLRPRVYGEVTLMHGGQGVVHDAARGVAVVDTFGGSPRVVRYGREDVALDLTDATGRAHAAWWVLSRCYHGGWPNLHTGARLWLDPAIYCDDPNIAVHARRKLWDILRGAGQICDWLARLNPNDPRLLPDGSRWVDAEALRLVCLHVAGLPS